MGEKIKKISIFFTKVLAGLIFSVLLIFLYSVIQYFSGINGEYTRAVIFTSVFVGSAYAGFLNANGRNSMGWFCGMVSGAVFGIFLIMTNFFLSDLDQAISSSFYFIMECMLSGIVGGIIGINMGKRCREK